MAIAVILMAFATFNFNRSMAWKIDVFDDGLVFYTLLGRSKVLWTNVTGLRQRNWAMETNYVISCRDGSVFKFSSGLKGHAEIIALIREKVSGNPLSLANSIRQDRISLIFQFHFILCSVIAGFVAATAAVEFGVQLFCYHVIDSGLLYTAFSWLGVCLFAGFPTLLRAKCVFISTEGLTIKTWIGEKKIEWAAIRSVRTIPLYRAQVLQSTQGCYLLGEELSNPDVLAKAIDEKLLLIKSGQPSGQD